MAASDFSRVRQLMGDEAFDRLRQASVTVCGLGAVGSFAVEALARTGIGSLRLVDFDNVASSNLNRQLLALYSTLGQEKVTLAAARVKDIAPECKVEALHLFIDEETLPTVLDNAPDVLLDAIDGLNSKVQLIRAALSKNISLVSSMGAASKWHGGPIETADLSRTHHCPLARLVRRRLHRFGIEGGFTCVFSAEPVTVHEAPEEEIPTDQERGRIRMPMGSLAHVTGSFGLRMAEVAILKILGKYEEIR